MFSAINTGSNKAKTFLLTDRSDITNLPRYGINGIGGVSSNTNEPVYYGSIALLISGGDTTVYMLMPNNEWTEM